MLRPLLCALLVSLASPALAQSCPDFYRFVDFGLEGRDGTLHRGGPVFRAESFTRQPLLLTDQTACLAVREIAKDGPGNPIPVVGRIAYDPALLDLDLTTLSVFAAGNAAQMADQSADAHRKQLGQMGSQTIRGDTYLCATSPASPSLSCQFASPYGPEATLVVYCEAQTCRLPAMAMNERVLVAATWQRGTAEDAGTGPEILRKITQIHDALAPISSGL